MTHDELLSIIDINALVHPKPLVTVVKLHAPCYNEYFAYKGEDGCSECGDRSYPCPTIQAIELVIQELGYFNLQ